MVGLGNTLKIFENLLILQYFCCLFGFAPLPYSFMSTGV